MRFFAIEISRQLIAQRFSTSSAECDKRCHSRKYSKNSFLLAVSEGFVTEKFEGIENFFWGLFWKCVEIRFDFILVAY